MLVGIDQAASRLEEGGNAPAPAIAVGEPNPSGGVTTLAIGEEGDEYGHDSWNGMHEPWDVDDLDRLDLDHLDLEHWGQGGSVWGADEDPMADHGPLGPGDEPAEDVWGDDPAEFSVAAPDAFDAGLDLGQPDDGLFDDDLAA